MGRNDTTSAVIDGLLRFVVAGGTLSLGVMAPGMLKVLDKPTHGFFKKLDQRARQREYRRLIAYMKSRKLIAENYQHGLRITRTGMQRIKRADFDNLTIDKPSQWDGRWRIVMFDIPQSHDSGRRALTNKLKQMDFVLLQQSVWIHPFPCRHEVSAVCAHFSVTKYVTYIETSHIDYEYYLKKRFANILS